MKIYKAVGHDLIPARALKESAEILCSPFGTLFNFILETGKIPQMWKKVKYPVHKKESFLTKGNYGPLTILHHGCDNALLSLTEQW